MLSPDRYFLHFTRRNDTPRPGTNTRSRMTDHRPLVSIVCPAYHEQEVLPSFHQELCRVLAPLEAQHHFEILYVDDGSKDATLDAMKAVAISDQRVRALSLARNVGKEP